MKLPDSGLPLALGLVGLLVAAGIAKDTLGSRSLGDHNDDDAEDECSVCGGPAMVLGALGTRTHYRCRSCGADWSVAATPSMDYRRGVRDGLMDERDLKEEP
jgi:ribosomal protein L37E